MKINGIEIKNVFPVKSEANGDGYEIRVTKYIDGKKKTMQETFYNKSGLKDFALITKVAEIKEKLTSKIATGEAKNKAHKPKKFSEISAEYLASKSGKSSGYHLGRARIVRELDEVFGNKCFNQIKQTELEQYVLTQNKKTYGDHIARAKDMEARLKIHQAELEFGVRKLNEEKGITLKTISNARKGENIAYTSAQKLCSALKLNFDELFIEETTANYYSQDSLESVVETIYAIFERARKDKQIAANPIPDYELFSLVDGLPPKGREILNDDEHKHFLEKLDKMSIYDALPFEIMVNTGVRTCEVEGLSWSDIDFDHSVVNIRFNLNSKDKDKRKKKLKAETKTHNAVRTIPMNARLKRKLLEFETLWKEMKEGNEAFSKCDAVYCDLNGEHRRKEGLNDALERILYDDKDKVVKDDKWITCHCLRHRWITDLIDGGMDPTEVQYLGGHGSLSTTMMYYHRKPKEKIAEKFLELFKEAM